MSRVLVLLALATPSACAGPRPEARSESIAPPSDLPIPEGVEEVAQAVSEVETPDSAWEYYRARYDRDGDKRIERSEYTRSDEGLANLDVNQDGVVSGSDFAKRWEARRRPGGKPGDFFMEDEPELGQPAPAFRLRTTDGEELDLERFRGRPVALVFGSVT